MPIRVDYHREAGSWWADSPDLEGFVAAGSDLEEVRALVHDGIPFYTDAASVEIEESAPWASGVVGSVKVDSSWGSVHTGVAVGSFHTVLETPSATIFVNRQPEPV